MDTLTFKEVTGHSDALFQQFHQVLYVFDRHLWIVRRDCIVSKGFLHPLEYIDIVHNETTLLPLKAPIGSGNTLHQGVVFHRLVQIESRE